MSTLGAIYKSLSGLMGFSKGLDTLSGNVANMNTPGYKGRNSSFNDIADTSGATSGVKADGDSIKFLQGDLKKTGINTNMGIQGEGFFVLRDEHDYYYTRAGDFVFDESGILVDKISGRKVQSLGSNGLLADIQLNEQGISAPLATTELEFSGNLYPLAAAGTAVPTSGQVTLSLFDSQGNLEAVNIRFVKLDPTALSFTPVPGDATYWKVSITPATGSSGVVSPPLQTADINQAGNVIAFTASGAISNTYNNLNLVYTFGNAAAENRSISLDFGGAGTFSGLIADANNNQSNVVVQTNDGRTIGYTSESKVTVDNKGFIKAVYTNGDEALLGRIALAQFLTNQDLIAVGENDFKLDKGAQPIFGYADDGSYGLIMAGEIESSNVELSSEFSEIIILQRGYQASSQVLNATNKMLEELYNSTKG